MKKYLAIIVSLIASLGIVFFVTNRSRSQVLSQESEETSILSQEILSVSQNANEVHKLYANGELLGVVTDMDRLNRFLANIYQEQYAESFPDSSVALSKDIYLTDELSYFEYEDIDEEILSYLDRNHLFAIGVTKVNFEDENGIYAEIYVKNVTDYEAAMQQYLSYFIDSSDMAILSAGGSLPELKTYGSRALGVSVAQTITTSPAYASSYEVLMDSDAILEYLKYGNNTEKEYYTVQRYDTVAGVGAKNYGLSATQIMNINRDVISSVDQVLSEGEVLCVTYFNSPIDVIVTQEALRREIIYADTEYIENEELRQGVTEKTRDGENGLRNSLYTENWVNGILVNGSLVSSVEIQQPVSELIEVGTMILPGVGTGTFRWPTDNPIISCGWGCYYGHRAIDVQNIYNKWDNVYVADSGVVEVNSYNGINGNYVMINHNNGYHSYYGHMANPSPIAVGTAVEKGDVLGTIGMTGYATGPHVHFFIFDDSGSRYNPCNGFLDCGY